ncbi:MAG: ATP-binding protein [Fibromonadaceae bacterium]|jgi:hypothetical protein|nr:ATP-binding protein [Fibromonadaceae bacterium]
MLRKLPLSGVQTFADVINDFAVYVDKTSYIHDMISNYKTVFLSRPRRFGKSLTCSTLKAIFENQKDLFKGLAIENLPWNWKEYPVIHLDMSAENCAAGKDRLVELVNRYLKSNAEKYGVDLPDGNLSTKFQHLIETLFKTKGKVAIIIDEYDCPLLDAINHPQIHTEIKEELKGFYKVLKASDQYIQFVFITGITKFAQVSLFSGMNQPEDISFNSNYAAICGFTQSELETYFEPEINEYSKRFGGRENYLAKLKNFYNGYKFAKNVDKVYNPISVMKHFGNDGDFRVFWAETGTPSFLANYIDKNGVDIADIENMVFSPESFGKYNDDEIFLVPLMYQAGYLTINDYEDESGTYKLGYPNMEVRSSFSEFLSKQSGFDAMKRASVLNKLFKALQAGDVDAFMETIKIYMQSVKYDLITKMTEYYFEFAFSNILNMLGFNCEIEVHSAIGNVDAIIKLQKNVFVIEAKLDKPVEEALRQIEEKKYYVPYMEKDLNIFKIGVVFGEKERNIVEWKRGT